MPSGQEQAMDDRTGGKKGLSPDRYDLIPAKAFEYLALIYGQSCVEHGGKYDARNWEKGYPWGWSPRALCKHVGAVIRGGWLDPDSGLPHIMHAAWHCFAICTFYEYQLGTDDRTSLHEAVSDKLTDLLHQGSAYNISRVPTREEFEGALGEVRP